MKIKLNSTFKFILKFLITAASAVLLYWVTQDIGLTSLIVLTLYLVFFFTAKQITFISLVFLLVSFVLYEMGSFEAYEVIGNYVYSGLLALTMTQLGNLIGTRKDEERN